MTKIISILNAFIFSLLGFTSCAQTNKGDTSTLENMNSQKILIAYFSHIGENYGVGNITEGNTHIIAKMISENTGGKMFEIVPANEYPKTYNACVDQAKQEKEANARPSIKSDITVEDYDVIFIGYPNWWGDMPMPVYTFLEKHNWNGKTIIPFCTHEGSGLSSTEKYIANTCSGANVLKGLAVRGTTAQNNRKDAKSTVNKWLTQIKK